MLKASGAEIVDPVELDVDGMSAAEREVLEYEFKTDLRAYLQRSDAGAFSEKQLISMAYAFEQASKARRAADGL